VTREEHRLGVIRPHIGSLPPIMTVMRCMFKVNQSSYQVTNTVFVITVLDSYSVAATVTSESS
jgi:hypothetical protein